MRNVPPPTGGKAASSYARFIPREELGDFAAWSPDAFGSGGAGAATATGNGTAGAAAASARESAAPTAAEARAQAAAARQAGYADGYRDGLVALDSFKQSHAAQVSAQIGQLMHAFDAQLSALEAQLAEAVACTAVQLARQVLRTALQHSPALVATVAAEAVNAVLLSARQISVHVHPQDQALVALGAAEAFAARGARLMADPAIARGGVLVVSDAGSVDARIATRWAQAMAAVGSSAAWDAADGDSEAVPPAPKQADAT